MIRAGAAPGREDGERGSGTVTVLGVLALAVALLLGVGVLVQSAVAHGRAVTAADQAALAAADAVRMPVEHEPCPLAEEVAVRHGAELLDCALQDGGSVRVEVSLRAEALPWAATAVARAGPPPFRPAEPAVPSGTSGPPEPAAAPETPSAGRSPGAPVR